MSLQLPESGFVFAAGATVGSFLNVVIHRVPRGESVVSPRSRCPSCSRPIEAWNNIPIFSWLLLRGRCAHCKATISARYPLVEFLTAMLWVAVFARFGLTAASAAAFVFVSSLVAITFVDLDFWEIPDEISLPGIVVGILARPLVFDVPWYDGLLGALVGGGILYLVRWTYEKVRHKEGMGMGDIKLLAMLAAFLGPQSVLPIVLVSSIVGLVIGSLMLVLAPRAQEQQAPASDEAAPVPVTVASASVSPTNDEDDDNWVPPPTAVPFGPFLALGGLCELLVGPLVPYLQLLS